MQPTGICETGAEVWGRFAGATETGAEAGIKLER